MLCAPFALHGAAVADLAPGHSLVVALRDAGLRRLFVTDWRSATVEMRFLGIDDYLADLNVLVDRLGGSVDLVGLCQGGWLSLLYAARFPAKVRKLVLAGAPIDIAAGRSALSALADASPLALFHELVKLGDGRVLGHKVQKFWGAETIDTNDIHQTVADAGTDRLARFRRAGSDIPGLVRVDRRSARNLLSRSDREAVQTKRDRGRSIRRFGRTDRPGEDADPGLLAGGAR